MTPSYKYATLNDAIIALNARLYGPFQSQFPPSELTLYVVEALRQWNALTSFWRREFPISLDTGTAWYDLSDPALLPAPARPVTVTDNYLTSVIAAHLIEPSPSAYPLVWAGSSQFSIQPILDTITRRQNETLGASGCTISRQLVDAPIQRAGIVLPDTTIDIRRVAWLPTDSADYPLTVLRQTDVWSKRAFDKGYTVASERPPQTWMQNAEPPPRFDVDYVPPVTGKYEVLSVNAGSTFNITAAQLLSVPDDWSWVVKWGVLAELLGSEANSKDAVRADYCQKRYVEGLSLLSDAPSVVAMQLNSVPVSVDALTSGDKFNSQWQAQSVGAPLTCYTIGLNLLAFTLIPDGPYGALATIVANAPVPTRIGDYIEVSRDVYEAILNNAQHLAMFKIGGREFLNTIPLYQAFLQSAALYNGKLNAMAAFWQAEAGISKREQPINKRVQVSA